MDLKLLSVIAYGTLFLLGCTEDPGRSQIDKEPAKAQTEKEHLDDPKSVQTNPISLRELVHSDPPNQMDSIDPDRSMAEMALWNLIQTTSMQTATGFTVERIYVRDSQVDEMERLIEWINQAQRSEEEVTTQFSEHIRGPWLVIAKNSGAPSISLREFKIQCATMKDLFSAPIDALDDARNAASESLSNGLVSTEILKADFRVVSDYCAVGEFLTVDTVNSVPPSNEKTYIETTNALIGDQEVLIWLTFNPDIDRDQEVQKAALNWTANARQSISEQTD